MAKTIQKIFAIDKAQGQKTYQAALDHARTMQEAGVDFDLKMLMPGSLLIQETGLLFPELVAKWPEKNIATQENKKLRQLLSANEKQIYYYSGIQDKEFAATIASTLSSLAELIPDDARHSPEAALRSLLEIPVKKEKPRLTRKEKPRLAPVTDTSQEGIEESINRAMEGDPLTLIAADLRKAAEQLPDDRNPESARSILLADADKLETMVSNKHAAQLQRVRKVSKAADTQPGTEATATPSLPDPGSQKNPMMEQAVKDFFENLQEVDALCKDAGITDDMVRARFGDTSALEVLRPEGASMAAVIQTLCLSPRVKELLEGELNPNWVKGRVHAAIMDFASNYRDYLEFNQSRFPDGVELFVVTNNRGFGKGVETKLKEAGNMLRSADRFHVFESGDSLERYFKKHESKYLPPKEATPVEKVEAETVEERKPQRRPASTDDMQFIAEHLQAAAERIGEIRSNGNWPRVTRNINELLDEIKKRGDAIVPGSQDNNPSAEGDWVTRTAGQSTKPAQKRQA